MLPVLLLAAVAGSVQWRPELAGDLMDRTPALAPPPAPVPAATPTVPVAGPPSPVADPRGLDETGTPDPARVRRALAAGLRDPDLGGHVVVRVAALAGGAPVFTTGRSPVTPASTTKLLTATAVLSRLGPDHVFTTRVVAGDRPDRIVLVGGGDPLLLSGPQSAAKRPGDSSPLADVGALARATADALRAAGVRRVHVDYDTTLFTGPRAAPSWESDYLPDDVVSPITALWVDEGRGPDGYERVANPPAYAARVFAAALAERGVRVVGRPVARAAREGAGSLAEVHSPPLGQIVERMIEVSDNEAAEVLAHHVGLAVEGAGSFAGGARGVEETLRELGIPLAGLVLHDGSGLSRANRLDPRTVVEALRVAAAPDLPELRAVVTGLPVAAFTGSLSDRFAEGSPAGRGMVRAKTGTLTGVSALAGLVTARDGTTMVFVLAADRIEAADGLDAQTTLDRLAAALAACRCGR